MWRLWATYRIGQAGLTRAQMWCLVLYCFDGLSYGQIAVRLDVSVQSVKGMMHRARKKLERIGLRARRLDVAEHATVIPMDPGRIEKLPLRQIRGRW